MFSKRQIDTAKQLIAACLILLAIMWRGHIRNDFIAWALVALKLLSAACWAMIAIRNFRKKKNILKYRNK